MKAKLKGKADAWLKKVQQISEKHGRIEQQMDRPDDYEEFVAVGMALGQLQLELERLREIYP